MLRINFFAKSLSVPTIALSTNLSISASVMSLPTREAKLSSDDDEDKRIAPPLGTWGWICGTSVPVFAFPLQAANARRTVLRDNRIETLREGMDMTVPPVR
jgi:hypothetical protein